ncbi:uncharacterized protein LOC124207461 [Daphnia pulex]|uniref:uncharacterized protein LOC124207461 n=1 Tax=Daphnia pulex TaxID=6669 RepID=UPI001EE10E6A|nr:uncharacterized protein LOC124207461 [Daphnia pulex]
MSLNCNSPRLKITRQPQSTYNFPYESEVKNGRGYLYADPANEKRWIRVQLENWEGEEDEVCIRCSLVTDSPDRSPHFHRLGIRKTNRIHIQEYQDGVLSKRDNCITATFPGLSIVRTKIPNSGDKEIIKMMWLRRDSVRIKFEAFVFDDGTSSRQYICNPVYSQPIGPSIIYSSVIS